MVFHWIEEASPNTHLNSFDHSHMGGPSGSAAAEHQADRLSRQQPRQSGEIRMNVGLLARFQNRIRLLLSTDTTNEFAFSRSSW